MTREGIERMTDDHLANYSAIYRHKADVADDNEDWAGFSRFMDILDMIEDERGRRAERELSDGGK